MSKTKQAHVMGRHAKPEQPIWTDPHQPRALDSSRELLP